MKGVREVTFDTTGTGYLKMRKKATPDRKAIEKALAKQRVTITKLEKQDVKVALRKYELTVTGVG